MATGLSQLELRHYSFSKDEFRKLAEPEQLFFIRLGLVSDDLRHLHHLMLHARVALKASTNDMEKMLGMHQLMFALRMYYGTLNEAWRVIHTGWFGTKLSQTLDNSLPDEAQKALAALKRYFERGNTLTETIRHNFAFHFIDEPIKEALKLRLPEKYDGFVGGDNLANIFYMFAENVLFHAMLLKAGVTNIKDAEQIRSAVAKIYKEGLRVSDYFTVFANAECTTIRSQANCVALQSRTRRWRRKWRQRQKRPAFTWFG
jgi:hypothetical protein